MNLHHLMQGRIDAPLNEHGIRQAEEMRQKIGDIRFDAVYSSPLQRARRTACIIGNVPEEQLRIDSRIIEVDFGRYEGHRYHLLGPAMTLYWVMPEIFPAPPTVETVAQMIRRSQSFLKDLERKGQQEGWEDVLVTCHGGIMRTLCGYLENRKNGILWRPKPKNCEVRVYECSNGTHRHLKTYLLPS